MSTVRSPMRTRRITRGALIAAIAVIALLAASQLILPTVATDRIDQSLRTHASGVHVEVHALPAIKLLFGEADRVTVRIDRLYPATRHGHFGDIFARLTGVGRLDAHVNHLLIGSVTLQNVSLDKSGSHLRGQATLTRAAIDHALPVHFRLAAEQHGSTAFLLRLVARVFSHDVSATATVSASDGRLVIAPDNPLLGLLRLTLFNDPHAYVTSVTARPVGGGYVFAATAQIP